MTLGVLAPAGSDILCAVAEDSQQSTVSPESEFIDPWELLMFRRSLRSPIRASDPEYDLARRTFNALLDRRPAVIVPCETTEEVREGLDLARRMRVGVAVRGGGHGVAGHSVGDGALVIDLARFSEVEVDPGNRTATAGGGTTWAEFDRASQEYGLATPGGTFGSTGVAGLTLGGGIGHLLGVYGLTCDNLIGMELVTASGEVITASEHEHVDLFWALRGGGGNFGVVTKFVYRVHPIYTLLGGLIVYPLQDAREALRLFRDVSLIASDELTCMVLLERDEGTGERAVVLSVCYTGPSSLGQKEIRPLQESLPVLTDAVRPMSYLELQAIFGELPFGYRNYWKGQFVQDLPDELIDFTAEHYSRWESSHAHGAILIEPLHGAATRGDPSAMAFNQRGARFNVSAIGIWERSEDDEKGIRWARDYAAALEPYSDSGGYLNYANPEDSLDRVAAAFGPEKFARLRQVKRMYDPDNLFRFNHNIPPAT